MRLRPSAVVVMLLAACAPPEFLNPLTPAAGAKIDAALLGSWLEAKSESKPMRLEITAREGGVMSFLLPKKGKEQSLRFEGHVSVLGATRVLNLKAVEGELAGESLLLVRYELAADGTLRFWVMRDAEFRRAVKDGSLKGRTSGGSPSTVIVSDTPEKVRAFVNEQKSDELWEPLASFKKG